MNIRDLNIRFQDHEIEVKLPKGYFKRDSYSYPLVIVQGGDDLFKDIDRDVIFVGLQPNEHEKLYESWQTIVDEDTFYKEADDYISWIAEQLLPYLRKCFNISKERVDISLAGASLGGLVVLYALFKKPETFGTYILISPSIWYPGFITFMNKQQIINQAQHVYWYVGMLEDEAHPDIQTNVMPQTEQAVDILNELLVSEQTKFYFMTHYKGMHQKLYFKKYFNKAIKKLF
ncbi:MAG TPA: alpha/beta hydrolase-fold protein [Staphylococcus sp.]|nr:alpha/beta hydrolase-fold protein [Staphylococcus sp.]